MCADKISDLVIDELIEMQLIKSKKYVEHKFIRSVPWANVLFTNNYQDNLNLILMFLNQYGLVREYDDIEPITNWGEKMNKVQVFGSIVLAGRYSQWKYYWSDDCVLRGKIIH